MISNFSCASLPSIYLFGKMLFLSLAHDLVELFFTVAIWEIFIFPRYSFFVRYVVCKYLLQVYSFSFYPFNRVFHRAKVLISMESNLSIFLFMDLFLVLNLQFLCLALDVKDFYLYFFLKVLLFCITHLTLWSILS